VREQMVLLRHHAVVIPTQPVVDDDVRSYVVSILKVQPIAVLVGVARGGITGVVERSERAFLWNHLEQALQVVETNPPPRILIKFLVNAGAMEFAAELNVVLVNLPGKTVDNLTIRVDTLPRVARCRSQLREEAHASSRVRRKNDDRQAGRIA